MKHTQNRMSFINTLAVLALTVMGCESDSSESVRPDSTLAVVSDSAISADVTVPVDSGREGDAIPDSSVVEDGAVEIDALVMPDLGVDAGRQNPGQPSQGIVLGLDPAACDTVGLLAPSLPADAGHYVATVLTPREHMLDHIFWCADL